MEDDDIFGGATTKPLQFHKDLFAKHLKNSAGQQHTPQQPSNPHIGSDFSIFSSESADESDWESFSAKKVRKVLQGQPHELLRGFTDKQLLTSIYVLEKLTLNTKLIDALDENSATTPKDSNLARLAELGSTLFRRSVVASVFGEKTAQEYLQEQALKKAEEHSVYSKNLKKADIEALSSCEIRQLRKQKVELSVHQLEMPQQLFLEDSNANTEGSDDSENINNNNTGGNADTNSGNASGSNNNNSKATRRTRRCHICKAIHNEVHFFYDQMCLSCGDFNYAKRNQTVRVPEGCIALVTGGRIKIGYQIVLKLLRAGATVIVTTRFSNDAAKRFTYEKDFGTWKDKLVIYGGLDFRDLKSVEKFCDFFKSNYSRLDVLINNAAQTVWKPPEFYAHLLPFEKTTYEELPQSIQPLLRNYYANRNTYFSNYQHELLVGEVSTTTKISEDNGDTGVDSVVDYVNMQHADETLRPFGREAYFPQGKYDADKQQIDLRTANSWVQKIDKVPIREVLETHAVTAIAPFIIINKLKPLMVPHGNYESAYIINVSAMEGSFSRYFKPSSHPHTNMAKASMNMITRTSASGLAKEHIYMNSVDTGWVSDEMPYHVAQKRVEMSGLGWEPPLDDIDGASRVLDPVFVGIAGGTKECGKFLKDYKEINW